MRPKFEIKPVPTRARMKNMMANKKPNKEAHHVHILSPRSITTALRGGGRLYSEFDTTVPVHPDQQLDILHILTKRDVPEELTNEQLCHYYSLLERIPDSAISEWPNDLSKKIQNRISKQLRTKYS